MALVTIIDAEGRPMLIHTSQLDGRRYPAPAADAWGAVWARFGDRPEPAMSAPKSANATDLNTGKGPF